MAELSTNHQGTCNTKAATTQRTVSEGRGGGGQSMGHCGPRGRPPGEALHPTSTPTGEPATSRSRLGHPPKLKAA